MRSRKAPHTLPALSQNAVHLAASNAPPPATAGIPWHEPLMAYRIDEIEVIGTVYSEQLAVAEIHTTEELLAQCAAPEGREALSATTGIPTQLLLSWTNMADLMRIAGIGKQFSELLDASGVDTVAELRSRSADRLTAKMIAVNGAQHVAKTSPTEPQVAQWIAQAKALDPCIRS